MQVFHFFLALIQPALQIKDARDAGEVDALARQLVDQVEPIDIGLGVHARGATSASRRDQTLLLIGTQDLRVHARQFRGNADHVQRPILVV